MLLKDKVCAPVLRVNANYRKGVMFVDMDNSRNFYRQDGACSCAYRDAIAPLPDNYTVTMAYVPVQTDITIYDDMQALEAGTLFPVLNKPFLGSGCSR